MTKESTKFNKVRKSRPLKCIVTSDKMNQSRVATRERLVKEQRVGKYLKKRSKIMFHDPENKTKAGDVVLISPSRPFSARKKFILTEILESK